MKRLIAFLLFVFILNIENNFSQCGAMGIELKSQKDVDEFPINYPGCYNIGRLIDRKYRYHESGQPLCDRYD